MGDTQKITQAVDEMYNSGMFTMDQLIDWEDKLEIDKAWVHCQSYYNELYTKLQRYNKARPSAHGFESAANVGEKWMNDNADLKTFLCGLEEATRADNEHIQQMSSTNGTMVDLCQQQAESNLVLQKQVLTLVAQLEKMTTMWAK